MLKVWYRILGKKDSMGIPANEYQDGIVFMKRMEKISKNAGLVHSLPYSQ